MQKQTPKVTEPSAEYQAFEQLVRKAFATPKPEFDEAELEAIRKVDRVKPNPAQKK